MLVSSDFGEGSFDKGIFLTIPYNSILPYQTTGSVSETIKPIQGDGGARVFVNDRLYKLVNDKSINSLKLIGQEYGAKNYYKNNYLFFYFFLFFFKFIF